MWGRERRQCHLRMTGDGVITTEVVAGGKESETGGELLVEIRETGGERTMGMTRERGREKSNDCERRAGCDDGGGHAAVGDNAQGAAILDSVGPLNCTAAPKSNFPLSYRKHLVTKYCPSCIVHRFPDTAPRPVPAVSSRFRRSTLALLKNDKDDCTNAVL